MAWCPKCKNEYVEGITVCADCGTELVESLEESADEEISGWMDDIKVGAVIVKPAFLSHVVEKKIEAWVESGKEDGGEAAELAEEMTEELESIRKGPYQNSAQKAEENRSSAYTLLFVGVAGLMIALLVLTDVIPLYQNAGTAKYFVCGVMSALFILFIVFGVISMKNFKILSVKAKSEDSLVTEMTKWCNENLTAGQID